MTIDVEIYREQVEALLDAINTGDSDGVQKHIDDLTKIRETDLFRELGALTRDLHDALKTFEIDPSVVDLTEKEIPDAKERLNYVIQTTEQAAHRTLEALEAGFPLADDIAKRARELSEQWGRFKNRNLTPAEFRQLSKDLEVYLENTVKNGDQLREKMNDALMAQEYQDITGQILRRVIEMVHMVEENLVYLIKLAGRRVVSMANQPDAAASDIEATKAQGPQVPGTQSSGAVVSGQDEVDDLLSSLGF